MTWQEITGILENNKEKNNTELGSIFNKNHSWVSKLRKFYNATDKEKEDLKDKDRVYSYFYKLWTNKDIEEKPPIEEHKQVEKDYNYTMLIIYFNFLKSFAIDLKHCKELNKQLLKENAEDALEINRLINVNNKLEKKILILQKEIKLWKRYFYGSFGFIGLVLIILIFIKGV